TAGAAATATRTAISRPTATRGPGTAQYIRTVDTAAAPAPAVITAAAADQYRPVSRTSSHVPATAVTAAKNTCGAPGLLPGGTVAAATVTNATADQAAPSPTTRGAGSRAASTAAPISTTPTPASVAGTSTELSDTHRSRHSSAAATASAPPMIATATV